MVYEVPSEQLKAAYSEDEPLQKLLKHKERVLKTWENSEKEREESHTSLKEEVKQEAAQLKKLNTLLNAKRRKLESLGKKRRSPSVTAVNRRIVRRKALVRDKLLSKHLSTQKEDFLLRWKKAQNEVNKEE